MALYLAGRSEELGRAARMLDLAPSLPLSRHVRTRYPNVQYRTADLNMKGVDDRVDVMDMAGYEDGSFDCLLCSHVLEHVNDDRKAIGELHRVLRPGGWGLILVPVDLSLMEVVEDSGITDAPTRWRLFAQGDHVRMYSQEGLLQRLSEAGFAVSLRTATQFGAETLYRAGICLTSAVYVAERRPASGGPG
jgi:SAM-dependent methyltransferase